MQEDSVCQISELRDDMASMFALVKGFLVEVDNMNKMLLAEILLRSTLLYEAKMKNLRERAASIKDLFAKLKQKNLREDKFGMQTDDKELNACVSKLDECERLLTQFKNEQTVQALNQLKTEIIRAAQMIDAKELIAFNLQPEITHLRSFAKIMKPWQQQAEQITVKSIKETTLKISPETNCDDEDDQDLKAFTSSMNFNEKFRSTNYSDEKFRLKTRQTRQIQIEPLQ